MSSSNYFLPTLPSLLQLPSQPYIHRDLSWLLFNERVLNEARTTANPLLERAKFLAITASNLDEFFMIRFAGLSKSVSAMASKNDPQGLAHLIRIHDAVLERVAQFTAKQSETLDLLSSELDLFGVHIVRSSQAGETSFEVGLKIFNERILPHLPSPEGFLPSKLNEVENLKTGVFYKNDIWFRVSRKLPPMLFEQGPDGDFYFYFLDDLISQHLGAAHRLEGPPSFVRFTRDGDIALDLQEEKLNSILESVRSGLGSREKGRMVRLQYSPEVSQQMLKNLSRHFKLSPSQVTPSPGTLYLHGLWAVFNQVPETFGKGTVLRYPHRKFSVPDCLNPQLSIFDVLKQRDLLLHHPYDSFEAYLNWLSAACEDPQVTEIQQTIYRMDPSSPIVELLKRAAKNKRVRVLIELRARFDEANNLKVAEELQEAGAQVAFGFGKLKLHAKIALVARQEGQETRYYTHLSTGNYHSTNARFYEDFAVLSARPELGEDAKVFFESVAEGEVPKTMKYLVHAPTELHKKLSNLIRAEIAAAKKGEAQPRIVAKVNALVDEGIIDLLYEASQAGVKVDLIVRGACSLIPGVKGLSENIRVISVVDRYLEHSRIYFFQHSQALYLSSADWMPRNFFSRLELAFPVLDPVLYSFIEKVVIPAYLADTVRGRELTPQGLWKKRTLASVRSEYRPKDYPLLGGKAVRSQFFFEELAAKHYVDTPLFE